MNETTDLDDDFMQGLMQMVTTSASDTTASDSELSLSFVAELGDEWDENEFGCMNQPSIVTKRRWPKRVRKGAKNELLDLRTQVAAYKKKLSNLLAHKHEMNSAKVGNFWQRTAHRVALEKQLAIRENERLRVLVGHQMNTVKELQTSILTTITNSGELYPAQPNTNAKRTKSGLVSRGLNQRSPPSGAPGKASRTINVNIESIDGNQFVCVYLEDLAVVPMNCFVAASHAWKVITESNVHAEIVGRFSENDPFLSGVVNVRGLNIDAQVTIRKELETHSVAFAWEIVSLLGTETGSVRFVPSPEDPDHSFMCISSVQFSPQLLGEGGEAAVIATMVSLYDATVGLQRKAVSASLEELVGHYSK